MKKTRQRKAFTIVEMSIVIAVIAILAAVAIPVVGGIIQRAKISSDQNTAANLTVQLALWEVDNGAIDSEDKLRDAINSYYGGFDANGKLTNDFYASLKPESAKYGYNYWYDIDEKRIVVATCDELVNATASTPRDWAGNALDDVVFQLASAGGAGGKGSDISKNHRHFTFKNGKSYVLLDRSGSSFLVNVINSIDNMRDQADFSSVVTNLKNPAGSAAENEICEMILDKWEEIPVFNEAGIFAFDNDNDNNNNIPVEQFYFPQTGNNWGNATYVCDGNGSVSHANRDIIQYTGDSIIPPSHTKAVEGAFNFNTGFIVDDVNNPLRDGAAELHLNIKETELGNYLDANSTNCVIVLPTGRYILVENEFKKLDVTAAPQVVGVAPYTIAVESFSVNVNDNPKAKIEGNILYIAEDNTANIVFDAHSFVCKDQNDTVVYYDPTVTWMKGESVNANSTFANLADGDTVTAKAQKIEYTYTVKIVKAEKITDIKFGENEYVDIVDGEFKYNIEYKKGTTSWSVDYVVGQVDDINVVKVDTVEITSSDETVLKYNAATKSLEFQGDPRGDLDVNISITCGSATRVCAIKLIDATTNAFGIADNANTQVKYNLQFTIGTVQAVTLGTLFELVDDSDIKDDVYLIANTGSYSISKDEWENYDIVANLFNETNLSKLFLNNATTATLKLSMSSRNGSLATELNVTVIKDVYNITTVEQWNAVTASKIVLLEDITLNSDSNGKQKNAITYLNGNGHMIKAKTFVYTAGQGGLIRLTSGKIENVIINGPVYSDLVYSGDASTGMFTFGVWSTGTSQIINSYVSGFKAAIRLDNGTLTLSNSVIDGGTHANVYVYKATKLILDNSVTIQKQSGYTTTVGTKGKQVVGSGIFVDSNQNTAFTVEFKNGSYQYNWLDSSKSSNYYVGGTAFDIKDTISQVKSNASAFVHNSNIVNMGVFQDNDTSDLNVLAVTGSNLYSMASFSAGTCTKKYFDIVSIPKSLCSTENCKGHTDPTNITIGSKTYVYSTFYADINK